MEKGVKFARDQRFSTQGISNDYHQYHALSVSSFIPSRPSSTTCQVALHRHNMPAKRSANSGQSPASSKRSKTTTEKVDFEIRPTFHTEQASTHAFPTDIDSLDVDHVLVAGDFTDSEWYQRVVDRLSYYSSEISQASDDQRCRYVWNLWNQFSLRRLWMAAGYTHEAEWSSQNEEVYRYVYYTLGYGASQLNLVPPSTFRGLSAPVGKLHTQFGELWMYELGLFGKVAELLGMHEVTTIKAALEYSILGKIRYGLS
jgi:hypothetical protein